MRARMVMAVAAFACVVASAAPAHADFPVGKIVVSGDEWAFSDAGLPDNPTYVNNVVSWFGLSPAGTGKKVLILDGQSWNAGYSGTYGAFGNGFRNLLTGNGVAVTYLAYDAAPISPAGYDAVFVDGLMTNAPTLPADLASFVSAGGKVYVAGGTGTFSPANSAGEAAYWQPFFTAATGSSDFGLVADGWFAEQGALTASGPVGQGVANLDWYLGQSVQVGTNPNASAAIVDSSHTLVATWSATVLYQGDANEDGKVSFADYIILANNFGQTGATWQMGDFNGDGKVSFADYILLANNFGQHVPEPATLGLLLVGGLGLIRRNRKKMAQWGQIPSSHRESTMHGLRGTSYAE